MRLQIGTGWCLSIGMAAVVATLIGVLGMAVHKVRIAAARTSDL